MNPPDVCEDIAAALKNIPQHWDGRKAILEMKAAGYPQWRQMEWIGFYFQFLCEQQLAEIMHIPGPRYGRTGFDGFKAIPWDFKAHAANTLSHQIIVNDREAVTKAIEEYGEVGIVLAVGNVEYNDESRTFQRWHDRLKGGKSEYVKARIARGSWSRLRKVAFRLREIDFIQIGSSVLQRVGSFQRNFRNSDGRPRRDKILLDLERIQPQHRLPFV